MAFSTKKTVRSSYVYSLEEAMLTKNHNTVCRTLFKISYDILSTLECDTLKEKLEAVKKDLYEILDSVQSSKDYYEFIENELVWILSMTVDIETSQLEAPKQVVCDAPNGAESVLEQNSRVEPEKMIVREVEKIVEKLVEKQQSCGKTCLPCLWFVHK